MPLTKEKLTAELASVRAQKEQALANLNVLAGAVQTLEQLVAMCDQPEPVAPEAPLAAAPKKEKGVKA